MSIQSYLIRFGDSIRALATPVTEARIVPDKKHAYHQTRKQALCIMWAYEQYAQNKILTKTQRKQQIIIIKLNRQKNKMKHKF